MSLSRPLFSKGAHGNRAELAKSLKAYVKNHFSTGSSSVTTSQYPLLPPAPEPTPAPVVETESTPVPEKDAEVPTDISVDDKADEKEEPVTDVVDEQVGSGEVEPVPTPSGGGEAEHSAEEVTDKGGVEQVDEELQELKVEEEDKPAESSEDNATETAETSQAAVGDIIEEAESSTPQVSEETTTVEDEPAAPAAEPRKQERIENPTYTLETVGNKYNTGNFW